MNTSEERKNPLLLLEIEPKLLSHAVHRLLPIPTMLSQLPDDSDSVQKIAFAYSVLKTCLSCCMECCVDYTMQVSRCQDMEKKVTAKLQESKINYTPTQ
jgi:hypothetical protein